VESRSRRGKRKEGKEGGSGRVLEVDRLVFFLLSCVKPDVGRFFALPHACRQVDAVYVISCKDLGFLFFGSGSSAEFRKKMT
jgi:hypothetical protein